MPKSEKGNVKVMSKAPFVPFGWAAFVAFIGAFVYFAQNAHDFIGYFNAFFAAIVWPGIVLFHILQVLHA